MHMDFQAAHPLALQLAGSNRYLSERRPATQATGWSGWLILPILGLLLWLGWLDALLALGHVAGAGIGLVLGMLAGNDPPQQGEGFAGLIPM